ncbi:suppressor APC domain-containing protein 2 isoform X2 [Sceloporus undulatus]|uniref:suppressor APC domain-containing protein 2 isoform X2 n=1 Tax=Sceloporus undulatus TaxID=8520 RepID=UPI001C4D32A1|nr:suppressor APC domain-containing protein 2 isoform X2 [Sceloporus undulatus]
MAPLPPEPALGALPPAFLQSLRTLFDILDDRRRGFVPLREIESRWLGAEAELPRGVLEGLRRAAPPDGRLTFPRFVLGLRASLLSPTEDQEEKGPRARGASRRDHAAETCGTQMLAQSSQNDATAKGALETRRQTRNRGEHRRHTITNGVDYGMLKRMKELEKEKDFLLQGLEMVEQVRDWYRHQIHRIQERQKHLAQSKAHKEVLAEGSQSHLHHFLPKLQDLNQCLRELLSFSAKPLSPCPAATNGPTSIATTSPPLAGPQQTINMLKEQNWLLTKHLHGKDGEMHVFCCQVAAASV